MAKDVVPQDKIQSQCTESVPVPVFDKQTGKTIWVQCVGTADDCYTAAHNALTCANDLLQAEIQKLDPGNV